MCCVSSPQGTARPAESSFWVSLCPTESVTAEGQENVLRTSCHGSEGHAPVLKAHAEKRLDICGQAGQDIGGPQWHFCDSLLGVLVSPAFQRLKQGRWLTSVAWSVSCRSPGCGSNVGTVNLLCWSVWGPPCPQIQYSEDTH